MVKAPDKILIELLSDATFSKGEETPGIVDIEVEHDSNGLPFIGGKTLHGLLRDSWLSVAHNFPDFHKPFERIFGLGKDNSEKAIMRISDGKFDQATTEWINYALKKQGAVLTSELILDSLTSVRTRTSQDEERGTPEVGSLRTVRVANRGITLEAELNWFSEPDSDDLRCLAVSALATRHGGQARNRGCGHIKLTLSPDYQSTVKLAKGGS